MSQVRWAWTLPATRESVGQARHLVSQTLASQDFTTCVSVLAPDSADVLALLTSEVVTNAVLHGVGPLTLHLVASPVRVQVEVDDAGRGVPVVRPADQEALGGRGLRLVQGLSESWGVDRHAAGKTVWFRVPTT
jgi:anti-sigma regulatory factor (Ser/Thr protein kinase)